MKAFSGSRSTHMERAGLILLLTEKLIPMGDHDEHSQTDILTFELEPRSRLPGLLQWLWESVTRYSGVTVPDSHGVP